MILPNKPTDSRKMPLTGLFSEPFLTNRGPERLLTNLLLPLHPTHPALHGLSPSRRRRASPALVATRTARCHLPGINWSPYFCVRFSPHKRWQHDPASPVIVGCATGHRSITIQVVLRPLRKNSSSVINVLALLEPGLF
jgi:hypothetical protein